MKLYTASLGSTNEAAETEFSRERQKAKTKNQNSKQKGKSFENPISSGTRERITN